MIHRRPLTGCLKASGCIALVLFSAAGVGCAARGATPRPFPGAAVPAPPAPVENVPASPIESPPLVETALELRGIPYRNGGSDRSGFDCSGFVQYVFAQHGHALPREVREQYELGRSIAPEDVRAGDLVFFETERPGASHVGIALDQQRFVHAPSSRGVVRVENYTSDYWATRYLGAKRVR